MTKESDCLVTLEVTSDAMRWHLNHTAPGACVEIAWKLTPAEAEAMVRAVMSIRADQAPKAAPKPTPKPQATKPTLEPIAHPRRGAPPITRPHTTSLRRGETVVVARYSVARRR